MDKLKNTNKKAIVYIDGFNLYYGIKSLNRPELKWLDVQSLAHNFLDSATELLQIKYFTSIVKAKNQQTLARQTIYLDALNLDPKISIFKGNFLSKPTKCPNCKKRHTTYEEKKTDVNIACELLADAYEGRFDVAVVVSGDSDLVPAIKKVITMGKELIAVFPPKRHCNELNDTVTRFHDINLKILKNNLFPTEIFTPKGKKITCPPEWQ